MFHAIEKYKRTAQVILGLIALTFVGFGASTLAQPGHDYVAKVGDIKISEQDVNEAVRQVQSAGGQLSREEVYQRLLQQAYFQQGGLDLGADASLNQIKHVIATDPEFQENGQFSQSKYQQFLQQRQISEAMLIEDMRKQFAIQSVVNLIQGGVMVADSQASQLVDTLLATRQVRTAIFDPEQYAAKVSVDDAALQQYYQAHQAQYEQEEAVKFEFVVLSAKDLGAKVPVSEDEIKQAYELVPADASGVRPSLESIKAQLIDEIKMRKGQQNLAVAKEQMADLAFNNPNDLQSIADKFALKIESHNEWLTRQEAQAQSMPEALQEALFSEDVLVKKHNSEPVSVGSDLVWVVRAKEVRQKHIAQYAEVQATVREDYLHSESLKLAMAAATEAQKQAQAGKADAVAWSQMSQLTAEQARQAMPAKDFQLLLQARPQDGKPAYVLLTDLSKPVLMQVSAIDAPQDSPQAMQMMRQQLAQGHVEQLMSSFLQAQQKRYPAKQGAQKIGAGL